MPLWRGASLEAPGDKPLILQDILDPGGDILKMVACAVHTRLTDGGEILLSLRIENESQFC